MSHQTYYVETNDSTFRPRWIVKCEFWSLLAAVHFYRTLKSDIGARITKLEPNGSRTWIEGRDT